MPLFGRGSKRSLLDLEDQTTADLLKNIAESVFNSVELQKQFITEFETGLVSSLLLIISNRHLSKKVLQEINAVIGDIKFAQRKMEEGDHSWEQLERLAIGRGLSIYAAFKESPREHFLKSLNLLRERGGRGDEEEEEEEFL